MTPELFNPASYVLNLHAVPTLLTAIAVISLGLIVLLSERQSRVSASFFAMTGTAAIWLSSYSLMYCAVSEPAAAAWAVIGQFGVTFIPASVYYFTVGTLQIYPEHKIRVWLIGLVSAAFYMTVIWSDVFLSGVYHYWWGYYPKYQWMSVPFLGFFFGMMALSLHHYWREFHGAMPGTAKQRSNALFIAFCVAYLGSFDYFAAFGIPLYPFGYLPVLGFIILTARAVWRYRLVDITPAFAAKEIINAMADALLVLDNEGIVRVANSAACRLFARTEQRLLGSRIQELAAELASPGLDLHRRILSGSLRDFEFPLPPAERGGTSAVSVSVSAMRDQEMNPVTFVCIIRDITQREKARGEIQRHTERQTALYEVSLATASTLELRVVLNVLLEKVTSLVPQTATTIMLLSDDKRELIKVASRGIDEDAWKADAEAPGSANSHPVLESKNAIVVSNLQIHNEGLRSDYFRKNGFISYLGVPLIAQDQVLGILSFYCPQQRYFSDEEINFLRTLAGKALERRRLIAEASDLRRRLAEQAGYGELLGGSPAMRRVFETLSAVADSDANVLVVGESGTGKELVANAVHDRSARAGGPWVKVNCAALPKDLIESELFGHVKGAFTGAVSDKVGLFEEAHRGSLLLDEITEMPIDLQAKLLRVLEDRTFRRIGGAKSTSIDFRLICSTNRVPEAAVRDGLLRQDLYFRVNTVTITVPPLRARMDDIPVLAQAFLERYRVKHGREVEEIGPEAYRRLIEYPWPGNVRELQHAIEHAVLVARARELTIADLPEALQRQALTLAAPEGPAGSLEEVERAAIMRALESTGWNKQAAAALLGLRRTTLYSKMRRHNIPQRP